MSVDVVLLLHVIYSRTIAHVANVFCWLYPTLNKIYLILSYHRRQSYRHHHHHENGYEMAPGSEHDLEIWLQTLHVVICIIRGHHRGHMVPDQPILTIIRLNSLRAKFFVRNTKIYLHLMSFLLIDMAQVVKIFSHVRQELTYSIVDIVGADVLATQGARALTTMI